MAWMWTILVLAILAYLLREWTWTRMNKTKKLPPSPRGLPIFGNLHMFGKFPHRDLHRLAQKYGPIMHLRLGFVPTIVLMTRCRPPSEFAKHISYKQKNLSFSPYGPYWRNIRKMCNIELLSNHKINSFISMRKEELGLLVKFIEKAAFDYMAVDLSAKVLSLSADMSCLMVLGKKYMDKDFDDRGFKAIIQEGMHLGATPNLGDYLPYISLLDLQGLTRCMKAINKIFDDFLEKVIDAHVQSKELNKIKDFVDIMLSFMGCEDFEYRVERSNIKAIILDMIAGSMDTTATTIEWAISEVIKHPSVMKKLQKELEDVVGLERMVEESDLDRLEYLDMVVKETMRLHQVAPLLIPHESIEDITIQGFHIPKKSSLMVNVWAIGQDPSVWTDAEKFFPERFVGSSIDVRGRDFQLLPFGSGRRGCPGLQLDLTTVRLVVAQPVHCFDWEFHNNMLPTELDMTEEFGLTVPRAKHLLAIPRRRLHK
ncbi:hypothetical protein I3842_04G092100 [Carya illinoinensis]|uniref:Cytochrome P450 n=1 Tax=Carya illinoinensis TaxID=32201 RepID=A0A922JR27_CARIL|nr:hypothetical protein I3842_04G092100 [Carya illinoinensis]